MIVATLFAATLATTTVPTSSVVLPSEPVRVPVELWVELEVERQTFPIQALASEALKAEADARVSANTAVLVAVFAGILALGASAALAVVARSR